MAKNKKIKAILFDLDGTLMNTKQGILLSLDQVIEKNGLEPIPFAQKKQFVGPPMKNSLMSYYGLTKTVAKKYAMEFRDLYAGDNCLLARTYPHMRRTLAHLKLEGYRLAVATYKREDVAKRVLDHFKLSCFFDIIYGTDFEANLTKSEILEKAIKDLGATSETAVMLGDTMGDAQAAQDVGCMFIPVTYGYGFIQEKQLGNLPHIGCCHSVDDIRDACKKAFKTKRS